MISLLLSLSAPALAGGDQLRLIETTPVQTVLDHPDIPEAVDVWVERIDGAQRTLDLSHFYVAAKPADEGGDGPDPLRRVLDALDRAATRGVAIRFIVDGTFRGSDEALLTALDENPAIDLRRIDLKEQTGGVQHAKYMVIDGERVVVGSQNFDWRSLQHVQELGMDVQAPALARIFGDVFESDWTLAGGGPPVTAVDEDAGPYKLATPGGKVQVRPALSPQGLLPDADLWDLPQLVAMIDGAKSRVRVQVMSYTTKNYDGSEFHDLDDALRRAAGRGVQVQLVVSHWSQTDKKLAVLRDLMAVDGIEVRFATIPPHDSGFIPFARTIHSKYMVVDGRKSWVGTSNWSGDYFHGSRNMGLVIDGKPIAAQLDAVFLSLWDSPYAEPVDPDRVYDKPRIAN